jgi:hypothetical protein
LVRCSSLGLTFNERCGFDCGGECPWIVAAKEHVAEGVRARMEDKHLHKEGKQEVELGMLSCQCMVISSRWEYHGYWIE